MLTETSIIACVRSTLFSRFCSVLSGAILTATGLINAAHAESQAAAAPIGVVVESNSENYVRGQTIKATDQVVLVEGEKLVVLHRSGAVRVFEEAGHHRVETPGDKRASAAKASMLALLSSIERADMGATRSFDETACLALAKSEADITDAMCRSAAAKRNDAALAIAPLQTTTAYRAQAPMRFTLRSSFEAVVGCDIVDDHGVLAMPIPLGPENRASLRLPAGVDVHVPKRGTAPTALTLSPGVYAVRCTAKASAPMERIRHALADAGIEIETPEIDEQVFDAYSRMAGGIVQTTNSFGFEIVE